MARGIPLSTAGVKIGYCVETKANERPTTSYTRIHDIKEVPDFNPEPESHETTDLEQTEYKTYVAGLKDMGGALGFLANFTKSLQTSWEALVEAHKTAKKSNLSTWFVIEHPDLEKAVYFQGEPASMGLPSMSVNAVLETTLYITPTGEPKWEAKPTAYTTE